MVDHANTHFHIFNHILCVMCCRWPTRGGCPHGGPCKHGGQPEVVAHMVDHLNETSSSSQQVEGDGEGDGATSVLRRQVPRSGSEAGGSEGGGWYLGLRASAMAPSCGAPTSGLEAAGFGGLKCFLGFRNKTSDYGKEPRKLRMATLYKGADLLRLESYINWPDDTEMREAEAHIADREMQWQQVQLGEQIGGVKSSLSTGRTRGCCWVSCACQEAKQQNVPAMQSRSVYQPYTEAVRINGSAVPLRCNLDLSISLFYDKSMLGAQGGELWGANWGG
eukprot:1157787-Pelagomonas_calceolata.AAC.11